MARIRTIKPELWTDEKIGKLKREERLLFVASFNIADDQGVFKASLAYIKGQLFVYDDDLRLETIKGWLESLVTARMIIPFTYQNEGYYLIRTFKEHQVINRPSKSKFPPGFLDSLNTHGVLTEYSLREGKGKEEERKGVEEPAPVGNNLQNNYLPNTNRPATAPTLEHCKSVFRYQLGRTEQEGERFWNYYEGLNWHKGMTPIMNWVAFANRWVAGDDEKKKQDQSPQTVTVTAKML